MTQNGSSNCDRFGTTRRTVLRAAVAAGVGSGGLGAATGAAAGSPGDQLGQVDLPGHAGAVGITFDGRFVYTLDGIASSTLQVYAPPAGGSGTASLAAEKDVVDGDGNPVAVSAVEWDPTRGQFWGALGGNVSLLSIGDPADPSQNAVATLQFHAPGILIDGLAYDVRDDTLWYSPDVVPTVRQFQPDGTQIGTVRPKNADGDAVRVSGVAVGADVDGRSTLYVGTHAPERILRVHADDGSFVSAFATADRRIEDLACDPLTYAPNEAILTIFSDSDHYLAFEVESGTCPIAGETGIEVGIDVKPCSDPNAINPRSKGVVPVAIEHTDDFDPNDPASGVDVDSLRFGAPEVVDAGGGAEPAHDGHVEDVVPCEGDGDDDLVVHFPTEDTGFDGDEDDGRLEGETEDGTPLSGEDSVKIVGGGGGGPP